MRSSSVCLPAGISVEPTCTAPLGAHPGIFLILIMLLCVTSGCAHRHAPTHQVIGDAFLDPSNLSEYRDRSAPSTHHSSSASAMETVVAHMASNYVRAAEMIRLPDSIQVTFLVKDTSGAVLASHPLKRGHNKWKDIIDAAPIDIYLQVKSPWVGRDVLIKRVDDPYSKPINLNIMSELLHRAF